MVDQWLSIVVGTALVIAALVLARMAARLPVDAPASADENDPSQRDETQIFAAWSRSRRRRRLQMAGLLGLVGVLIGLGDAGVIPWQRFPLAFAFYWLAVLGLTAWIVLIALGDMLSARMHGRLADKSLERLHKKQEELIATADRLRQHKEGRWPGPN